MQNKLNFPQIFKHEHPTIFNVHELFEKQKSFGQQAADKVAIIVGSWKFIIIQSIILTIWVILNITAWLSHWDPYPFILMNLVLSLQAAYTAPIIMMSQNRDAERDLLAARNDYNINLKAEEEIRVVLDHLNSQNTALLQIYQMLNENFESSTK